MSDPHAQQTLSTAAAVAAAVVVVVHSTVSFAVAFILSFFLSLLFHILKQELLFRNKNYLLFSSRLFFITLKLAMKEEEEFFFILSFFYRTSPSCYFSAVCVCS